MKVALVGGVQVSAVTLQALLSSELSVCGVLGHEPANPAKVAGHARLDAMASESGVPYLGFQQVNDATVVEALRSWSPDLLFVVGLSQIVGTEILSIPSAGCVGFHPTRLPDGRGRAPVPWMILTQRDGAATFFMMDDGVDSGPIFDQEPFEVRDGDYASDVHEKIEEAIRVGLKRMCARLHAGDCSTTPQDSSVATYYGRRGSEDGFIDWSLPAVEIARLVRASSKPYPGAFCLTKHGKVTIWRASAIDDLRLVGVAGSVLSRDDESITVQTGEGQIVVSEWDAEFDASMRLSPLRVGGRLYHSQAERILELESRLSEMERRVNCDGT